MKMLKIFATVFLVAIAATAFSQAQFAIGIKGGPNFANLNTDASAGTNYKNRTGFHAGAFALIKLTKIGIQPEILFSQQGSTVNISSQNYKSSYSYVNIPIMLKLYTIAGINLQAGPQFGFLTKAESNYNPVDDTPSSTKDYKDAYKKSDVSLGLGVGWDLPFGMTIDGRYNLGLSNINGKSIPREAKNQVFQLSLGFKLIKMGN